MRLLLALTMLASTATNAALVGRAPLTPAGTDYQAYYDDLLDTTWLANAKAGAGSPYDDGASTTDGNMTWTSTQAWLDALNSAGHLGATNWRLPSMDVNGDGTIVQCGGPLPCPDNEMGHQSQHNDVQCIAIGICQGPFTNVTPDFFWSGSPGYAANSALAFYFPMNELWFLDKGTGFAAAWAVRSGDIGVVPAPASMWLLGSAVGMLSAVARRKRPNP